MFDSIGGGTILNQHCAEQKLLKSIVDAFACNDPPNVPNAWGKDSEAYEDTMEFWGKPWGELSVDTFHQNMYVFFKLPPENLGYFLGAMMVASLKEGRYFNDALFLALDDPLTDVHDSRASSFFASHVLTALTKTQVDVVLEYFLFSSVHVSQELKSTLLFTRQNMIDSVVN